MYWKKLLLIGLAVGAFACAAAPRAEARVSVGIGIGFPIGLGYYNGYPGYGCSPYSSDYYGYGPRRVVYVAPRYYGSYGRRGYYRHHHHHRYHRNWR